MGPKNDEVKIPPALIYPKSARQIIAWSSSFLLLFFGCVCVGAINCCLLRDAGSFSLSAAHSLEEIASDHCCPAVLELHQADDVIHRVKFLLFRSLDAQVGRKHDSFLHCQRFEEPIVLHDI